MATKQRKPTTNKQSASVPLKDRLLSFPAMVTAMVVVAAIGLLYLVYTTSGPDPDEAGLRSSGYKFAVGSPGIGEDAPDFTLPATNGDKISLSDYQGDNVLLYFHEGGGCQPCWDQIRDLEKAKDKLDKVGVDVLLPITTDPIDIHTQKMNDDGLDSTALSDPDLEVSKQYETNEYGMMGGSTNGHSFILVDGDGVITWRADYGGKPDYTMYIPVKAILKDLKADRKEPAQ